MLPLAPSTTTMIKGTHRETRFTTAEAQHEQAKHNFIY